MKTHWHQIWEQLIGQILRTLIWFCESKENLIVNSQKALKGSFHTLPAHHHWQIPTGRRFLYLHPSKRDISSLPSNNPTNRKSLQPELLLSNGLSFQKAPLDFYNKDSPFSGFAPFVCLVYIPEYLIFLVIWLCVRLTIYRRTDCWGVCWIWMAGTSKCPWHRKDLDNLNWERGLGEEGRKSLPSTSRYWRTRYHLFSVLIFKHKTKKWIFSLKGVRWYSKRTTGRAFPHRTNSRNSPRFGSSTKC